MIISSYSSLLASVRGKKNIFDQLQFAKEVCKAYTSKNRRWKFVGSSRSANRSVEVDPQMFYEHFTSDLILNILQVAAEYKGMIIHLLFRGSESFSVGRLRYINTFAGITEQ